jgi:hypothetical protein
MTRSRMPVSILVGRGALVERTMRMPFVNRQSPGTCRHTRKHPRQRLRCSWRHHRYPLDAKGTRGPRQPGDNSRRSVRNVLAHSTGRRASVAYRTRAARCQCVRSRRRRHHWETSPVEPGCIRPARTDDRVGGIVRRAQHVDHRMAPSAYLAVCRAASDPGALHTAGHPYTAGATWLVVYRWR